MSCNHTDGSASQILTWAAVAPITALDFLRLYPGHPIVSQACIALHTTGGAHVMQYAIRVLKGYPVDLLMQTIPQFVQVLRYDKQGYIAKYILEAAIASPVLAHQLIWNMQTNMFTFAWLHADFDLTCVQ